MSENLQNQCTNNPSNNTSNPDTSQLDTTSSTQEYNVQNVLSAIDALFIGHDDKLRKEANRFLLNFEKSQIAWDIAKNILNLKNLSEQAYYTALQIIKKKLRFDFGNYCGNKEIIISVAEFLIEKIIDLKENRFYVISNICRCFALFVVFAHQDIPDIIKVFVNKLNDQSISSMTIILMVFTFLAEIVEDNNIVIDEAYRTSYNDILEKLSADVVVYIDYMIKFVKEKKEEYLKIDVMYKNYFKNINKYVRKYFFYFNFFFNFKFFIYFYFLDYRMF